MCPALAPVPELPDELAPVLRAHGRLGCDANGTPLYAEKRRWLDDNVTDRGEQDAWLQLWDAIEFEVAEVLEEEREERS